MRETDKMDQLWQKVRRKHLFPQIPRPMVGETNGNVAIEMKSKQITVSDEFLDRLGEKITREDALEALLDHGVGHHAYCPWDLRTHLAIYAEAKQVVKDKAMAKRAASFGFSKEGCIVEDGPTIVHSDPKRASGPVESILYGGLKRLKGRLSLVEIGDVIHENQGIEERSRLISGKSFAKLVFHLNEPGEAAPNRAVGTHQVVGRRHHNRLLRDEGEVNRLASDARGQIEHREIKITADPEEIPQESHLLEVVEIGQSDVSSLTTDERKPVGGLLDQLL